VCSLPFEALYVLKLIVCRSWAEIGFFVINSGNTQRISMKFYTAMGAYMGRFSRNFGPPRLRVAKMVKRKRTYLSDRQRLRNSIFQRRNCTQYLNPCRHQSFPKRISKLSLKGSFIPPKNYFLRRVSVGVSLSAYRQTDKILSHTDYWPLSLTVKAPKKWLVWWLFCILVTILEIFYAVSIETLFNLAYKVQKALHSQ